MLCDHERPFPFSHETIWSKRPKRALNSPNFRRIWKLCWLLSPDLNPQKGSCTQPTLFAHLDSHLCFSSTGHPTLWKAPAACSGVHCGGHTRTGVDWTNNYARHHTQVQSPTSPPFWVSRVVSDEIVDAWITLPACVSLSFFYCACAENLIGVLLFTSPWL